MKLFLILWCALSATLVHSANAQITFRCDAGRTDECAFSILHTDQNGITNFVLASRQTHAVNDSYAGSRYCVVVAPAGKAQVRDWPPTCRNSADGKLGTVVNDIKAGQTYTNAGVAKP